MPSKKHSFARPLRRERTRHKLFVLAVEGQKTEHQYFNLFKIGKALVKVECIPSSSNSSPNQVLKRMEARLRKESLKSSDEAWLVVDRDEWDEQALNKLHAWAQEKDNYHMALSNPKFEYWLLLHFEDGTGVATAQECDRRLKEKLRNYDKSIPAAAFTRERINLAIQRAEALDNPRCTDWPRTPGSTVYRLVDNILNALQNP